MPHSGAAVVVCNHIAAIDPGLLVGVFPRPLVLMSKIENARGVLKLGMRMVGAFTVRRGTIDREALRTAEQALAAGQLLCIFPEGTRGGGALIEAHGGAAMLAARPAPRSFRSALMGSQQVFRCRFPWLGFPSVTIAIGEPFLLQTNAAAPRRDDRARLTDEIMTRIAALLPIEMRGR